MDDVASQHQKSHRVDDPLFSPRSPLVTQHFDSVEADPTISPSRNIYFMDGANRFISLPIQAGTSRSSHVARTFEQWLQDKLGYQQYRMTDHLPIVEDSVDLLAEDIMNRIKSRTCVRGLTGIRSLMIKIRAGHVYSLDQLDPIPSLSSDMMDFFQQFPLFIEITILVATPDSLLPGSPLSPRSPAMDYTIPVLISLENISANPADPSDPYYLFEDVSLIV
ncbi:hypothetical protein DM01DRAFT_1337784 [Hesseltinella vesiculosa]|uniref:Uncharacterized protein n=1 Tax=Hesseltinella vesiculosa TaxID=101127 RepID=A0A1X2GBN5_9FUNG|nr:hypothetical protein DM01DRAFT_1337784 [Hesseltinella vesiculosa]